MKRIIIVLALIIFIKVVNAQHASIVPQPVEMIAQNGIFTLNEKTCMKAGKSALITGEFIQKRLKEGLGVVLNKGDNGDCKVTLTSK